MGERGRWRSSGVLAPLLVALAALLGGGIYSLARMSRAADLVTHTREVSLSLVTLQNLVMDAETGERGYLVTRDPRFLEPYDTATSKWRDEFNDTQRLIHNPRQRDNLKRLGEELDAGMAGLAATIALRDSGVADRRLLDAMLVGKHDMDEIRRTISDILVEEQRYYAERQVIAANESRRTTSLFLGAALTFALAVGVVVLQRRGHRAKKTSRGAFGAPGGLRGRAAPAAGRACHGRRRLHRPGSGGPSRLRQCLRRAHGRVRIARGDARDTRARDRPPVPDALCARPALSRGQAPEPRSARGPRGGARSRAVPDPRHAGASLVARTRLSGARRRGEALEDHQRLPRRDERTPRRGAAGVHGPRRREFNFSLDYNGTLKTIAREMVPTLADWCAVDLLEGEDLRRLAVAHVDPTKVELVEEIARRYPPDPAAPGSPRSVLRSQRPYLLPVIPLAMLRAAARSAEHLEMIDRLRLHSAMVVPILGPGGPLGTLTLATAESHREYSDGDVAFLSALADRAAVAIENAKLVRELEATVRREQAEREEAEKAARFSEMFIGMVSHDLRNPLNSVGVAAQLILRTAVDERQRRPAARILSSSERMSRMIDQLLDFTRIRLGKGLEIEPATTDLGELARQIADETAAAHDRPIDVRQRGDTAGVWDADRLSQVLSNLLANAAAHGAQDKALTLELDADHAEHVHVRVSNDGQIDAALLDRLFEPFHGTSKHRKGTPQGLGLGLYITREIVEAHGGRIAVTSNDGRTTFRIDLPRRVSYNQEELSSEQDDLHRG